MYCVSGGKECNGCGKCFPEPYKCPICGGEPTDVYKDKYGEIFGCDLCIKKTDAGDMEVEDE
jgi:hypothetical protein